MACFHVWCGFEGRHCDKCAPKAAGRAGGDVRYTLIQTLKAVGGIHNPEANASIIADAVIAALALPEPSDLCTVTPLYTAPKPPAGGDAIPELKALRERVKDLEAQLQENVGVMEGMDRVFQIELRARTDALYMLEAVVQMLGPKARKVWKLWQDKGVKRVHTSWGPEAPMDDGEAIAQLHLDMEKAIESAVPIDNIDEHLGTLNFKE